MMRSRPRTVFSLCALLLPPALGQGTDPAPVLTKAEDLTWTTEAVGPERFVAVHGREAVVMGYPAAGLEVWAYPLQLVSNFHVSFLPREDTRLIPGERLLRRVEYGPGEVERIYVGRDFVVHERIFVPLHAPGAIFTYTVEGRGELSIQVRFEPSLNLMWPGALGGQSIAWDQAISGYVLTDPLYGFSAKIASPEAVAHDAVGNPAIQTPEQAQSKTLCLQPRPQPDGSRLAKVFVGYEPPHTAASPGILSTLQQTEPALQDELARHTSDLLATALRIETPDPELNRALAWSVLVLDQAWVCNPQLGCGEVAGYGPSRPGRRPQYAWFFAGDGLVATNALIDAGEYDRAREELAFIIRYQNKNTGMIWHELSQSAPFLDWETKYPYMYVHVDISFEFLQTLARYVRASGDIAFLRANWSSVGAAFHYCTSLIDPRTKLPVIPADKEGANEQDGLRDDLSLSSGWLAAAESFAQMAERMRSPEAPSAALAAEEARAAMAKNSWDAAQHFWIGGHLRNGNALEEQRPQPTAVLAQHVFSETQTEDILDRIASPEFQTDWGTRILSSASRRFDPNSYSSGSVSALGSAAVATSFWQQHRPLSAWQIWHDLLPWNTLDSKGHLHELVAGDFYHPETESVPEQTWSSAGYLSAAVQGLLGLSVLSGSRQVTFAPHLPAEWHQVSVGNVRVGASSLDLHLSRGLAGFTLEMVNRGEPVSLTLSPEIPLGSSLGSAMFTASSGKTMRLPVHTELHPQDQHATMAITVPTGTSRCDIHFTGGVQVRIPASFPLLGAPSQELKVRAAVFSGRTLTIEAFVSSHGPSTIILLTRMKPVQVEGARLSAQDAGSVLLQIEQSPLTSQVSPVAYQYRKIVVRF